MHISTICVSFADISAENGSAVPVSGVLGNDACIGNQVENLRKGRIPFLIRSRFQLSSPQKALLSFRGGTSPVIITGPVRHKTGKQRGFSHVLLPVKYHNLTAVTFIIII